MQQTLQVTESFASVNLSCYSHHTYHETDVGAEDLGSLSVVGAEVLFPVLSLSWAPVR